MRWILLVFVISILPLSALAADTGDVPSYVQNIDYTLEQPFGGESVISNLAQYIQTVYQFALGIVGIFAVVLIMFGGLRWVAAAGNESVIGEAKEIIISAVTGLVIALLSYTILAFINPQTTDLSLSVFRIPNTFTDTKIIDLPPCDNSTFSGQVCQVTGTGSKNCAEVTCNEIGFYNQQYCRGVACTEGGGCYRGPTDPEAYSCQNTYCGRYAQKCAETGYTDSPSALTSYDSAFNECTCPYYETQIPPMLSWPSSLAQDEMTSTQEGLFNTLCEETLPQETIGGGISADPASYGFHGSDPTMEGWNCGFGCDASITMHYGKTVLNCAPSAI